jgi:hypothetical protein
MKQLLIFICFVLAYTSAEAQLKTKVVCPAFEVDLLNGKVNGLKPDVVHAMFKEKFPCFTKADDENSTSKCGGGLYYSDKGISFFTGRDYVELSPTFKGKLTPALFNLSRTSLFNTLGHPKMKDDTWDAYQMQYGTLILYFNKANKVTKIQFSTKTTDAIQLCD